jgi:DNA (cytosine-5)-methyltransferase 1
VLAERFPGVPIYDDVRAVRVGEPAGGSPVDGLRSPTDNGRREAGTGLPNSVDLLCGGFPCQDLSVAGQRRGLQAGERSSLFFEFARVADELVPAGGWILIENVPGLLSSQGGRDFALVLATLAELGFHDLAWRVLDSRHFGVPQRRRRVFIVGRRASGRRAFEVLLEPESGGGDPQTRGEEGAGVAFASLSGVGSGGPDDNDAQQGRVIVNTLTSRDLNSRGADAAAAGMFVASAITASAGHHGHSSPRGDVRLNIGPTTSALVKEQTPAVTSNAGVRRLTPVECERLQGLPDDWTRVPDTAPDSRRYAGLGDAVTSPVAEWIGRRILTHNKEAA